MSFTTTFLPFITNTTPPPGVVPVDEYMKDPDLVKAVQKATDPAGNCAPTMKEDTGELTEAQKKSIQATMGAMGVSTCKTTQAATKVELQAKALFAKAAGSAGASYQTSMGCEQVNVISNIMSQCTKQLSCMLNEIQSSSAVNVKEFQEIYLEVGNIDSSNVKLGNLSESNVKVVNIGQSSVQSAIGATLTQGINSAVQQELDLASGPHSDASSQKNMTQVLQNLKSVASNTTINKSVATASTNLVKDQKIKLYAGNISDSTIDISNVSKIDLISENYVYNALDQLFKTDAVQSSLNEIVQKTTATKKGLFEFSDALGDMSITETIVSIVAIIGFIVAVMWYFGLFKKRNNSRKQQQKQQQQKQQQQKQKRRR